MSRIESVREILGAWLEGKGHRLAGAFLPLKTLAVRSGLAEYGRNNICYVDGWGSHLQLVGAFTDLPCGDDAWRRSKAMDLCDSCEECLHNCPTGAITGSRFLLRAEICLTFHNESTDDFPDWIEPDWHHCLIGCMRCQSVCPMNSDVEARYEDRLSFTEAETEQLIGQEPFELLPPETSAKLRSLELTEDHRILRRNLRMLIPL
jgi:epoxyqueuosine reductase